LQTKFEGQPDVAQSPVWHLLSAPHVVPAGQSAGFEQAVPPTGPGGTPSVSWHWWLLLHE
jgi:hypothetical protein